MTKNEAIKELTTLSGGTLSRLFNSTKYEVIDDKLNRTILKLASMGEEAFKDCNNWMDVFNTINNTK